MPLCLLVDQMAEVRFSSGRHDIERCDPPAASTQHIVTFAGHHLQVGPALRAMVARLVAPVAKIDLQRVERAAGERRKSVALRR
jgi:hypothetical protein